MQEEKRLNCATALILACSCGHKAIVNMLIQKGALINYQDKVRILIFIPMDVAVKCRENKLPHA